MSRRRGRRESSDELLVMLRRIKEEHSLRINPDFISAGLCELCESRAARTRLTSSTVPSLHIDLCGRCSNSRRFIGDF